MTDSSLFRKVYIMMISFEMIEFIYEVALVIKSLVLVWGLFILIHNFLMTRYAFKVHHNKVMWAFLISMFITSCIHISVWFVPNIIILYYTALIFFAFYGMYMEGDRKKIEKEMLFLLKFWVVFACVFGILSLLSLLFGGSINVLGHNLGIFRNRLKGIYTNSNILAFSMVQSIFAADVLSSGYIFPKSYFKRLPTWFLILSVIVSGVCLFLTDSNAAFVFIIIYCSVRTFCNLFFKNKDFFGIRLLRSVLVPLLVCLVSITASFKLRDVCQACMSNVVSNICKQERRIKRKIEAYNFSVNPVDSIVSQVTDNSRSYEESLGDDEPRIGRSQYEISSGRIGLFKQGLELFKYNPILGIGRANLRMYGEKYLGGLNFPDLHNAYLTILVCYGTVGLIIFFVFTFAVLLDICKHLFFNVDKYYFVVFKRLFSALVAYCGYCLFEKAILFDMTFMVGFFWVILGYVSTYVHLGKSKCDE